MVVCGKNLAAAKGFGEVTAYLVVGPKGKDLPEMSEELLFVLVRPTNRTRVGDLAKVLAQGLGDNVQVPLLESFAPFENEFDLWGSGIF